MTRLAIGVDEVISILNEFNLVRVDQLNILLDQNQLEEVTIKRIVIERGVINLLKERFLSLQEED